MLRRALYAALVTSVGVLAWAAADLHRVGGLLAASRAGLAFGFTALLGVLAFQLRPRPGYGFLAALRGLSVSRPLGGPAHQLTWEDVVRVSRGDRNGSTLTLWVGEGQRILVPRNLFASAAEYAALVALLEAVKPASSLDS